MTTMLQASRNIRTRYNQSWMGKRVSPSRGLLLLIALAVISLAISVPWLIDKNAAVARGQVAVNALEDQRRDCVRAAESGADLQATSLAGVKHAEDTAQFAHASAALWGQVRDVLLALNPESPSIIAIAAGVDQYVVDVDEYAKNVAGFRQIAEQYRPRQMSECRQIGSGILDPLPTNPTVPD